MKLQITILLLLFIVAGGGSVVVRDKINQQDRKAEKLSEIIDGKTITSTQKVGSMADAPPVGDRPHCFEEKLNRIERDINEKIDDWANETERKFDDCERKVDTYFSDGIGEIEDVDVWDNADGDFERVDKELERAFDELNRAMEDL